MDKKSQIETCMKDIGMDATSIASILECFRIGEVGCGRKKLREYRTELLAEIQTKQKQLNCLDYLLELVFDKKKCELEGHNTKINIAKSKDIKQVKIGVEKI